MKTTWEAATAAETMEVGELLAALLEPQGILLLRGPLGAGKTVLAQGVARGLGIDPSQVQSPSFTLVREHYGAKQKLIHVDLYRLDPAEVEAIGMWEILASAGVKVVEWSERLPLPVEEALEVEFAVRESDGMRILTVIDKARFSTTEESGNETAEADLEGEL